MTAAPHPGTGILMTLCHKRIEEILTRDALLLDMLDGAGDQLPMELAAAIEQAANVYYRAAGRIRRRHDLVARPAEHSQSARMAS